MRLITGVRISESRAIFWAIHREVRSGPRAVPLASDGLLLTVTVSF